MKENTRIEVERHAKRLSRRAKQIAEIEEKLSKLRDTRDELGRTLPADIIKYLNYGLKIQKKDKPYNEKGLQQSKVYNEQLTEEKLELFQAISNITIEELIETSNKIQKFSLPRERELLNLEEIIEGIRSLNQVTQDFDDSQSNSTLLTTDFFKY